MAKYPKIDTPCPYRDELDAIMIGDHCTKCDRQVVDLAAMADDEQTAFLSACNSKVCVSYKARPAIAVAAMAAAAVAVPGAAVAQDHGSDAASLMDMIIVVGGINDPANAEYAQDPEDTSVPELPVVYEDDLADEPAK